MVCCLARIDVRWLYLLPLAAVFAAYWPSLGGYFLSDDFGYISHFRTMPLGELPHLFAADWSQGIWGFEQDEIRPAAALSFWLESRLWGIDATGYHVTNVAIHGLNALLVFVIAKRISGGGLAAGLSGALLFALHPALAEPITWITSRTMTIGCFFYLSAFALFVLDRPGPVGRIRLLSLTAYAAALFSHELAVTFPLMAATFDLFCRASYSPLDASRSRWRSYLLRHFPFALMMAGYVALRSVVLEDTLREDRITLGSLLDFISRLRYFFGDLLPPFELLWAALGIDAYSTIGRLLLVSLLLPPLLLLTYSLFRTSPRLTVLRPFLYFALLWPLLALLPTLVTDTEAGRYAYLPAAGLGIAVSLCVARLLPKPTRPSATTAYRTSTVAAIPAVALTLATIVLGGGWSLLYSASDWVEASYLSRQIAHGIESRSDETSADVLILNLEAKRGTAYLWSWSLPFALDAPFSQAGVYRHYQVLEHPDAYYCRDCWLADRGHLVSQITSRPLRVLMLSVDQSNLEWRYVEPDEIATRWAHVRGRASGDALSLAQVIWFLDALAFRPLSRAD